MMYRLYSNDVLSSAPNAATTVDSIPGWSFVFDPDEPLYQKFKKDVAGGVELQDPDGNVMTQAEADAFLETIP